MDHPWLPTTVPVQNRARPLVTLRDAAMYVTELPKAEQYAPQWELAASLLMQIAERGGDPMMARIAVMKALHRRDPHAVMTPRRKP
jgi:hypothetical protein